MKLSSCIEVASYHVQYDVMSLQRCVQLLETRAPRSFSCISMTEVDILLSFQNSIVKKKTANLLWGISFSLHSCQQREGAEEARAARAVQPRLTFYLYHGRVWNGPLWSAVSEWHQKPPAPVTLWGRVKVHRNHHRPHCRDSERASRAGRLWAILPPTATWK